MRDASATVNLDRAMYSSEFADARRRSAGLHDRQILPRARPCPRMRASTHVAAESSREASIGVRCYGDVLNPDS